MFIERRSWREVTNYHTQEKDHKRDKNTLLFTCNHNFTCHIIIAGKDQAEEDEGCTLSSAGILSR